jgi:glycosyltransferase involved in cell wall biosynthesis
MKSISVIILTFNSTQSIERTLKAAGQISDDIHVVDSFSSDRTAEICKALGCRVTQRAFNNYADQRNWAIDNLILRHGWQLHLDADEELDPDLVKAIDALDLSAEVADAYLVARRIVFMGRPLRFGGIAVTWHCRLFRSGRGRCEDRLYDQHFIADGVVRQLRGEMLDHQEDGLATWTVRHNRWSDLEAEEIADRNDWLRPQILGSATGTPIQRKRYLKGLYYRMPMFWRAWAYFLYRYIILLGFLDGPRGLIYHGLQGLWFRLLVDAKVYERRSTQRGSTCAGRQ